MYLPAKKMSNNADWFQHIVCLSMQQCGDELLDVAEPGVPDPYRVGVTRMLYRRSFTIPQSWASLPDQTSTFLHIDRVDWEAEVWINDVHVGLHRGG